MLLVKSVVVEVVSGIVVAEVVASGVVIVGVASELVVPVELSLW